MQNVNAHSERSPLEVSAGWNFADVVEWVAAQRLHTPAVVQGGRRVPWSDFDRQADGLAETLLAAGLERQDKVGQYLYNSPEYLVAVLASFKAGLVPVNTNYRYAEDELWYLWDNADAAAVVFHGTFAGNVDALRRRLPKVRLWVWVDDGSGECPEWAMRFELAVSGTGSRPAVAPWGRSGDDLCLLYTGGTTGLPKGVMWRQHDLYTVFSEMAFHDPPTPDPDAVRRRLAEPGPVMLVAPPLMHGTGLFGSLQTLCLGGVVVLPASRHFDPEELLSTTEAERVTALAIVGDAFGLPIVEALDRQPGRWDLSSLEMISSSGVMWSEAVKEALLRHHPGLVLVDHFASSEAIGLGRAVSNRDGSSTTARFVLGEATRVVDEAGRDVVPGSGQVGMVALKGVTPVGYYKDPEKSALTFRVIDGVRYSVPGDFATVEADGSISLLGRGSACINTGGEKVFPEEVEEVLKDHPAVRDAVVVGTPDAHLGETVCAVLEATDPGVEIDEAELIDHVKGRLAGYKVPRRFLLVESIARAPNGKVDYLRHREQAVSRVRGDDS